MTDQSISRRHIMQSSLAWAGAAIWTSRNHRASGFVRANERPRIGAVGTGSRWCQKATGIDGSYGSAPTVRNYGDYVAVCDADENRRELAKLQAEWVAEAEKAGLANAAQVMEQVRALHTQALAR